MRYLITHIAPKDKILDYKVSPAACNFCYNLISGNMFDKIYSILPSYVSEHHRLFNQDGVEYIYSSWRWKNRLTHKMAPIIENFLVYKKIDKKSSVWLYNMTMLNVWLVLLLRYFKPSVQINVIVLDFTPGDKCWKFFLKQINRCHGRILLANYEHFDKHNSLILPGVTPLDNKIYPIVKNIKREFLISGVLANNISMLSMLLSVFSKLPDFTLHITGMIEDDNEIVAYVNKYPNIKYYGCLPFADYLKLLSNVPFVLSTRNPEFPENRCNFPSKIIEGLLYNRIIISTIVYEQLNGIKYFYLPSNENDFVIELIAIFERPEIDLLAYANQSQIVQNKFSNKVWKKSIAEIENYKV